MPNVLLSTKAAGDIVTLKVSGSPRNFIVVQQGRPASGNYDTSFDSVTWLLMQDIYDQRQWAGSVNDYANSSIHAWLNNASSGFLSLLDADIRAVIPTVKIPYRPGSGTSSSVSSGANGLDCKAFLLSMLEVGLSPSWSPSEGATLTYFASGTSGFYTRRIANYNGSPSEWWTRSPLTDDSGWTNVACYVKKDGTDDVTGVNSTYGCRPALPLPSNLDVSDDGSILTNEPPTAPGSIDVTAPVAGQPVTVTLTAATDPDGTVAAYVIERSVDGGDWQQVQNSAALTFTETVGADWQSVQYRAAAVDDEGAQGPYLESGTLPVSTGAVTLTGPASGQGEHAQPFDLGPITLGVTPAPSDPAVQFAVLLDGAEAVSASHQSGDQITLHIDPRVMARGAHTITVTASKEAYSTAMAQYTYTVPAWDGSDIEGGASGVMQDHTGRKLLPKALAQDCLGPDGKDVATWIAELSQGGGSAATGLKLETGSYRGNGQSGEGSPNTLSFSGTPQLVVVQSSAGTGIFVRDVEGLALRANYYVMAATLTATWIDNGVSWFGSDAQSQLNVSSTTYRYVALIAPEN